MSLIDWILLVSVLFLFTILWYFLKSYRQKMREEKKEAMTEVHSDQKNKSRDPSPSSSPSPSSPPASPTPSSAPPATPSSTPSATPSATMGNQAIDTEAEDYIAMHVICREGSMDGGELLKLIYSAGLTFDAFNIFSKVDKKNGTSFCMANAFEPGTFHPPTMHEFKTKGIVLFTQFNKTKDQVLAFQNMRSFAEEIARHFGATLTDKDHNIMTEEQFQRHLNQAGDYKKNKKKRT